MKALVLRLDAPLMSFGGVVVDHHGVIDRFPATSMLTGLIGNALGWCHGDGEKLGALQDRLTVAARWDVSPERLIDYQTVDLGHPKMANPGWTTRGEPEHRSGGSAAKFGIHQRYRHHWMDGLMTAVVAFGAGKGPTVEEAAAALRRPARPLFIGRKACLPSRPLLDPDTPIMEGISLLQILEQVPVWDRRGQRMPSGSPLEGCWPAAEVVPEGVVAGHVREIFDRRDWVSQLPTGSTWRAEGLLPGGAK